MKWQNERAIRKAVITAIIVASFPPAPWAPQGVLLWWTAVKAAVQQAGNFLNNRCWWFPHFPSNPESKLLAQVAAPHLLRSFSFHGVSPALQLPAHAIHDKHGDTWAAQDPAVLYERQCRNNYSTLQWSGGGRRNGEKAEAQLNYTGWHLAAAVLQG